MIQLMGWIVKDNMETKLLCQGIPGEKWESKSKTFRRYLAYRWIRYVEPCFTENTSPLRIAILQAFDKWDQ